MESCVATDFYQLVKYASQPKSNCLLPSRLTITYYYVSCGSRAGRSPESFSASALSAKPEWGINKAGASDGVVLLTRP
jgi:hypothetical protein